MYCFILESNVLTLGGIDTDTFLLLQLSGSIMELGKLILQIGKKTSDEVLEV